MYVTVKARKARQHRLCVNSVFSTVCTCMFEPVRPFPSIVHFIFLVEFELLSSSLSMLYKGSLQSLDWTGGLDWWTDLKIIFMLANENSPVWLHLET